MRRHRKLTKDKQVDTSRGWRLPNRGFLLCPRKAHGLKSTDRGSIVLGWLGAVFSKHELGVQSCSLEGGGHAKTRGDSGDRTPCDPCCS